MGITVQTVINRALSKLGILGAGLTVSTNDNALCLEALIAILNKQITSGTFGDLVDITPTASPYSAGENQRVINNGTITLTLPTSLPVQYCYNDYGIEAYGTDSSTTRPPRDLAVIEECRTDTHVTNTYIYDARLRQWVEINSLTYTSICPLALRDENGLACLLATNVADEFSQQPSEGIVKAAYDYQQGLADNWSQANDVRVARKYY